MLNLLPFWNQMVFTFLTNNKQKRQENNMATSSSHSVLKYASVQMREHGAIVLDIRSSAEFRSGHIANAMHVKCPVLSFTSSPRDRACKVKLCAKLKKKIADVFPQRTINIFIYCSDGKRAAVAATMLETFGYRNVTVLGGMNIPGPLNDIAVEKISDPALQICHCVRPS
jgi:rhodanese-related sulfurtransferase